MIAPVSPSMHSQDEPTIERVLELLRASFPELARRFAVESLALFGSRVRGDERPDSDLDILVSFDHLPGLIGFVQLQDELGDILGLKVDLVLRDALKPEVAETVRREMIPV